MSTFPTPCRKFAPFVVAGVLLGACAGGPQGASRGELRFVDTETAGRLRHAAAGRGVNALAPAASRTVLASVLAQFAPVLLTLLEGDSAVGELEERLVECARKAERQVNDEFFGGRAPTRQECGEEVEVDGCGGRVTRAMALGQRKHEVALRCAREVLQDLWRRPYSIEQRYRYYPNARLLETVSREEEARLLKEGCTKELWRTIKPDLVLHADGDRLRSVVTLDYKFPCPGTNVPQWKEYGDTSAYAGSNQGRLYMDALGGRSFLLSPRMGLSR
ncbi:hypothetical protein HPC49_02675 [Pyxidicoccus fallax]|uniref:Lipoprotein n=1 Tax=Pyxidicoccus fallax TaxID=394095 RepID=A0A848L5Z9_9BACT|nr:hypothetical protein [Pyxidicoccus fallax]NMO14370.1 hypothetical protein [Pyxidicoccus fallax]NPC77159.1 hypothetical protein [Pyxidicoccus fallax]